MTDNEKLIEEAAEAMLDAARELLGVETIGERPREMTREYARRAFAVFEKAHTPTDDKREALLRDLYSLRGWSGGDVVRRIEIIDRAMAALRRTEVPEPGAEGCSCGGALSYKWGCQRPQREPSDAQVGLPGNPGVTYDDIGGM